MEHAPIGHQPHAVSPEAPADAAVAEEHAPGDRVDDRGQSDPVGVEREGTSLRADAELTAELEADLAAIEAELEALENPVT
jgi:hypothetical protein